MGANMGDIFRIAPLKIQFQMCEDEIWVGACPDLDIFIQGYSFEDTATKLKEALDMYLESCHRRGTLPAILKSCGIKRAVAEHVQRYAAQLVSR